MTTAIMGATTTATAKKTGKKINVFRAQKQLYGCVMHLLYISLSSLHDYDVKKPILMFSGGRTYAK